MKTLHFFDPKSVLTIGSQYRKEKSLTTYVIGIELP